MRHDEIDPQLPWIQVHRSVGMKAAQLAPLLGFSYQHVRGALDCFWEGLADRRILSGRTEIVLSSEDLSARLRLAFGAVVDIQPLIHAGLLEPREAGAFRVRGMSRYLNAESVRKKKKEARTPPAVAKVTTPTPLQPHSNRTEERGERREVRGERIEKKKKKEEVQVELLPQTPQAETTKPPKQVTPAERFYSLFLEERELQLGLLKVPAPPLPPPNWARVGATIKAWQDAALSQDPDDPKGPDRLCRWIVEDYCQDPYWAGATDQKTGEPQPYPWNALASETVWRKIVAKLDAQLEAMPAPKGAA